MPPLAELFTFALALIAAGAVAGVLAGLFGIGGGAILVPVFVQLFTLLGIGQDVAMHLALGTSLAIIVPTSIRSFLSHRKRGAVDTGLLRAWIVAVPLGVLAASVIAAYVSGRTLMLIFATMALAMALRMFLNRESWRVANDLPRHPALFAYGTVLGTLSGLMGIGGGVFNNIFMTLHGRSIHQAVATSSGLGVLISIPGLIGYVWAGWGEPGRPPFSTGYINWIAVALIIPVTLLVAPLGVRLAHALKRRQLEIGFGIFLVLISARFFQTALGQ
ncbi:sulfite exporter TauE/SafE family protein [Ensifer soli]|uniref:sulfite exporter TauE/SafE family protein n=1 Tax=Ciceribacter sp. sgz301302 TaxID=3342379 RepID=UPI0035BAFACA